MVRVICVSGSVGCGKTKYSKRLAKEKDYNYIDLNKIIDENKLKEKYDRKRKTWEVDVSKLKKVLIKMINNFSGKGIIIDGHLSHYLPRKYVDKVVIMKCELKKLKKRLEKRNYSKNKIRENLDAEIFDVCFEEAKSLKHKIEIVES